MKKSTKDLVTGGLVAIVTGVIGTFFGQKLLDKAKSSKLLGSKIAGDDDMGEEDPIVQAAKSL